MKVIVVSVASICFVKPLTPSLVTPHYYRLGELEIEIQFSNAQGAISSASKQGLDLGHGQHGEH